MYVCPAATGCRAAALPPRGRARLASGGMPWGGGAGCNAPDRALGRRHPGARVDRRWARRPRRPARGRLVHAGGGEGAAGGGGRYHHGGWGGRHADGRGSGGAAWARLSPRAGVGDRVGGGAARAVGRRRTERRALAVCASLPPSAPPGSPAGTVRRLVVRREHRLAQGATRYRGSAKPSASRSPPYWQTADVALNTLRPPLPCNGGAALATDGSLPPAPPQPRLILPLGHHGDSASRGIVCRHSRRWAAIAAAAADMAAESSQRQPYQSAHEVAHGTRSNRSETLVLPTS